MSMSPDDRSSASASLRHLSQTIRSSTSVECCSQAGLKHTSHSRSNHVSRSLGSTFKIGWSLRLQPSTLHFTKDMVLPFSLDNFRVVAPRSQRSYGNTQMPMHERSVAQSFTCQGNTAKSRVQAVTNAEIRLR
jgi:hypothetical protein